MRILPMNKAMIYLASPLISTSLFVSSTVMAMPLQNNGPAVGKTGRETALYTKTEALSSAKNPVLVRNTTSKPEPAITGKDQKVHDKKAVGRCWKRLMNMVHEVSHAHRTKSS